MTIEESKMMWKLEVENNKPLYGSFSKEMKRLYNKVDELINEGVYVRKQLKKALLQKNRQRR